MWINSLFENTRRDPEEFSVELRDLAGVVSRFTTGTLPSDAGEASFALRKDELERLREHFEAIGWVEGEPDHPRGFAFISPIGVEERAIMAQVIPLATKAIMEVTVADVGPGWDRKRTAHWAVEDYILVRHGDETLTLPAFSAARSEDHGEAYPLGGYPTGSVLEVLTPEGAWLDVVIVSRVYSIPEENFPRFLKRFEKMIKTAKKLEAEPPTYTVIDKVLVDRRTDLQRLQLEPPRYRINYQVIVEGKGPRTEGWRFIGLIDPGEGELGEGMFLVKMAPGEVIPERFRAFANVDPTWCEHCRKSRRRVKTLIVLNEETGESVQVGSSCVRDYTGHPYPQDIAAYLQWLADPADGDDDIEEGGYDSALSYLYDYETFLSYTARSITLFGWRSRSSVRESEEMATADFILMMLRPRDSFRSEEDKRAQDSFRAAVNEKDREMAQKALAWAPALWAQPSDYGLNMQAALSGVAVSTRTAGLVASLIPAYQRAMGEERSRELVAKVDPGHLGAIGETVNLPLVVVDSIQEFENEWGTTRLTKMTTGEGHHLAWWNSGSQRPEVGVRYTGSCKVKKHGEYRGQAETTVQRCNLIPRDQAFVKLTKKQASVLAALGVKQMDYDLGVAAADGFPRIIDGDFFRFSVDYAGEVSALLPQLPAPVQKKIRNAVVDTDIELEES